MPDDILGLNASVYEELKQAQQHNEALQHCIADTVTALFDQQRDDNNMYKPVCLLGKIQSGKTRAFIGVMAKVFDEEVNTVIVLTKNSTILGKQTTRRIANDLHSVAAGRHIAVDYITEIDNDIILGQAQMAQKRVIVGIKHYVNVGRISDFFTRHHELALNKILIIDDEADVSGIGYRTTIENVPFSSLPEHEQEVYIRRLEGTNEDLPESIRTERTEMLLVAEKINQLRIGLPNHRYLQVTATPASIFLQPEQIVIENYNDNYTIENVAKAPLLADKTILLPIHAAYVGGEFFFGETDQPESMAQFVHRKVDKEELRFMSKPHARHVNNIFRSNNFPRLTEFVDNILLTVASNVACIVVSNENYTRIFEEDPIRVLNAIHNKLSGFAAMVHTSTGIEIHRYQTRLIKSYIDHCKHITAHDPDNLLEPFKQKIKSYFDHSIIPSFKLFQQHPKFQESLIQNLERIDFNFIFQCFTTVLATDHVQVFMINSDQQIIDRIDQSSGELKREVLANIYIGGQSLDRGITLERLVGFFYGREPQVAQLDTTLQHARIYGARKPEDLIFTRMYMSEPVKERLTEITEIDRVLRQSIIANDGNNRFASIEIGANGKVRPTSPNRIMISNCVNLKEYKRFLPVGFQTREGNACERQMKEIDDIINQNRQHIIEGYEGTEKYFITWNTFESVFEKFMNGMIDVSRWDEDPKSRHWDLTQLNAFYKIVKNSYFPNNDHLVLIVKRNRQLSRVRIDGRLQDAPGSATTDSAEMKEIMARYPVPGLFLFEQEGREDIQNGINYGWKNTRFYWPMLMLPQLKRNIMISLDALNRNRDLT